MSFSPLDVYGDMLSEEMTTKTNLINEETKQCIVSSKSERICDTLVASEEIVVGANSLSLDKNFKTEVTLHEDNIKNCCDETIEYQRSIDSLSLTENSIIDNWDCENVSTSTLKDVEPENCNDEQDDSEETIATFVTAAGQQLALYAVEDSDEIFAVALYDESGEPPTNFQFLMKADVKRLIDEGAVRTLKKPAQMKKSVLTTESPVFYRKEDFGELHHQANYKIDKSLDDRKHIIQERDQGIGHNYEIGEAYSESIKFDSSFEDIDYTVTDKQSDIAYLMMDNNSENVDMSEQADNNQDNYESEEEEELILCSTVQYIFLEGERPESDLTFDEIQETLQNSKHARRKKSSKKNNEKFIGNLKNDYSLNSREILRRGSSMIMNSLDEELDYYMSSQSTTSHMYTSEDKSADDRQRLIDALTDSPPSADQPQLKMKRSRKQQLTSVNRDDGEIIIQPASMVGEQELTGKKRGRRRRGLASQMRVAATNTKRMRRKRREIVEVIDLDVEEEEPQTKSNVVEITIEDNKDKYSSDKENEIIMIRDSDSDNGDDEEDEEEDDDDEHRSDSLTKFNGIMRCEHCSRNFKQRRAFDTHLRVCQKSPENLLRLSEKKQKDKEETQQVKKQYACKICQEKFDVVVALARHVRAAHSQRKKHKLSLASPKIQDRSLRSVQQKEATSTEEEESLKDNEKPKREPSILSRVKRKRRQKNKCSWETKKLNCADCGRWFPSSALLNAHSLQHGTKKSEQLRKCYICKKLIRSRLLYLQHLKMHNDQRSSANSSRLLRRKLRGRPSARKIASPRKRGRPRKF